MSIDEMVQILTDGMRSGNGIVLCSPTAKPILTCRGEVLSGGYDGRAYNLRFTAKQCKKMLDALMKSEEMKALKMEAVHRALNGTSSRL